MNVTSNWPDLNNHTPLKEDQEYLKKVLRTVKEYADEDENICKWVEDHFQSDVVMKYGSQTKSNLKFLGIGSGDGLIELAVIAELSKTYPAISVTVVEPCPESVARYKSHVETKKEKFKGVTWTWCTTTIQQFCKESSERYDFVCLIHAMYFSPLKELHTHLKAIYDVTAPNGIIFTLHDTESAYFPTVERSFPDVAHALRPAIQCEYIKEALSLIGVQYHVIDDILAYVEVTKCFDLESEDGRSILDSMLQVKGFVEHSKACEVETFLDHLKNDIVAFTKDDRLFIDAAAQVMVIPK